MPSCRDLHTCHGLGCDLFLLVRLIVFQQFLTLAGKALALSSAPLRAFVAIEGMGGFTECFSVRELRQGDLVRLRVTCADNKQQTNLLALLFSPT